MLPIVRTDYQLVDIYNSLIKSLNNQNTQIYDLEVFLSAFSNKEYNLLFPKLRFGMELLFKTLFMEKTIGVPTYSCSVVPHSVVLSGNKVKFYDCNKDNLTTENFSSDLDSYIITPWYGSIINNDLVHKAPIFADFSHVNILDNEKFIDKKYLASFYSFSSGKPISSIGGGLVSTDNRDVYLELKRERDKFFGKIPKSFYLNEVFYSISGNLLSKFNIEILKTTLDDKGYLEFLREETEKIDLGKAPKKISNFQTNILKNIIEKNVDNKLQIFEFWKQLLKEFPIEILNTKEWSNSHMNTRSIHREKLKKVFNSIGIQTYYGSKYLNHRLKPYSGNQEDKNFPNAINNFNSLLQLPINLSDKSFIKLQKKEKLIRKKLNGFFD